MRFRTIHLQGFGIHASRTFELNSEAPIVLFYGGNEAGKSTVMGFVRSVLFGFASRGNLPERYEPVRGGLHGGYLIVEDGQGNAIRVERTAQGEGNAPGAPAAGMLRLFREDGSRESEEVLRSLMGGISLELYRNLFAFGLSELQEIRTLTSDEIGSFLYSTGMGVKAATVLEAERKLAQRMESLYKPRGSRQEINLLLKQIEQGETELRRSKEQQSRYNRWLEETERLDKRIEAERLQLARSREAAEWLDKCLQARQPWIRMKEIEGELAELPTFDVFPESATERYEAMIKDKERLLAEMNGKQLRIRQMEAELEHTAADDLLAGHAERIERLAEQTGVYLENKRSMVELEAEIRHAGEQIAHLLRLVGEHWNEQTLERFPLSVQRREQIRAFRERFARAERELAESENEVRRLEQSANQLDRSIEAKEQAYAQSRRLPGQGEGTGLKDMDAEALQALWVKLRREYEQYRQLAARLEFQQLRLQDLGLDAKPKADQPQKRASRNRSSPEWAASNGQKVALSPLSRLWPAGIVLNLLLPLLLWYPADQPLAAAAGFFLLAGLNGMAWMRRRMDVQEEQRLKRAAMSVRKETEELQGRLPALKQQLTYLLNELVDRREAAAALNAESVEKESAWDELLSLELADRLMEKLEQAVEVRKRRQAEWDRLTAELRELYDSRRSLEEQHAAARNEWSRRLGNDGELHAEWRCWMEERQLSADLTPEAVLDMIRYAEQASQLLQQKRKNEERLAFLLRQNEDFEQECALLPGHAAAADPAVHVKRAKEKLLEARRRREHEARLREQLGELAGERDSLRAALDLAEERIGGLWTEAGASDEEEFLRRARQFGRFMELQREYRGRHVLLETIAGEKRKEELISALRETDLNALEQRIAEIKEQIGAAENRLHHLHDQRGALRSEMEQLEAGRDHADKLQASRERDAGLQQLTARWAVYAMCAELFRHTKEIYEKEKQPKVLQKASEYFQLMTGGKYRRVLAPIGTKEILAERADGERLDASFLSRGTAEQLYLSMRFAIADVYADKTSIPVLMDDIFVNFDPVRLGNASAVLGKAAERHQILLFTCHPHVREAVAERHPECQVLEV
ncbi:AAA family ATPase [Ferviditalea candida]|uniref:AAA family ATPase n=1 Tax=Ferviditalea candida TaxID=3108399 RepID=A0ABU5ZCG0_9BACL|nr:AAA family ATPase [Paenibacillaceae bacterium T2]